MISSIISSSILSGVLIIGALIYYKYIEKHLDKYFLKKEFYQSYNSLNDTYSKTLNNIRKDSNQLISLRKKKLFKNINKKNLNYIDTTRLSDFFDNTIINNLIKEISHEIKLLESDFKNLKKEINNEKLLENKLLLTKKLIQQLKEFQFKNKTLQFPLLKCKGLKIKKNKTICNYTGIAGEDTYLVTDHKEYFFHSRNIDSLYKHYLSNKFPVYYNNKVC